MSDVTDLGKRMAFGLARERLTDVGARPVRDGRRVRHEARDDGDPQTTTVLLDGTIVLREFPVGSLSAWRADEIDMIEYGRDACGERTHTIADRLGVWCGNSGRAVPRSIFNPAAAPNRGYVVIWEKP